MRDQRTPMVTVRRTSPISPCRARRAPRRGYVSCRGATARHSNDGGPLQRKSPMEESDVDEWRGWRVLLVLFMCVCVCVVCFQEPESMNIASGCPSGLPFYGRRMILILSPLGEMAKCEMSPPSTAQLVPSTKHNCEASFAASPNSPNSPSVFGRAVGVGVLGGAPRGAESDDKPTDSSAPWPRFYRSVRLVLR